METFKKQMNNQMVKMVGKFLGVAVLGIIIVVAAIRIDNGLFAWDTVYNYDGSSAGIPADCDVLMIPIHGTIATYVTESMKESDDDITGSDTVVSLLQTAKDNDQIKAVLVEIDSYGGYPVAGQEIARAIKDLGKPVVGLIRGAGTSAGYMVASATDHVIASEYSDIGGIGVTASYVENKPIGEFIDLSSAKYKDLGNPDRPITTEERQVIMRDIIKAHDQFTREVAENRNLPIEQIKQLADGSTMLGEMALAKGLIDQIGSWKEAGDYIDALLGKEATACSL